MSTSGIFQLITNDGKQDRMLNATQLLNNRLMNIKLKKNKISIMDVEKSHLFFMKSHFKPFVAIGYEYQKTKSQGILKTGSSVRFSIPQFGDFIGDMVLNIKVGEVRATNSQYYNDPVSYPAVGSEKIKFVDKLALNMVSEVSFKVNGNKLDKYNTDEMVFYDQLHIPSNKRVAWNNLIGQENPIFYKTNSNKREAVFNGLQTPKPIHKEFDLWLPLLFWFNLDPNSYLPSVAIPYGQRFIDITFSSAEKIIQHVHGFDPDLSDPSNNPPPEIIIKECNLYINNLFVNPEIHDIYIKNISFSLVRVYVKGKKTLQSSVGNILMESLKWPVETIYIGFKPTVNSNTSSINYPNNWWKYHNVSYLEKDGTLKDYIPTVAPLSQIGLSITIDEIDNALGYISGDRNNFTVITAFGNEVKGLRNFFKSSSLSFDSEDWGNFIVGDDVLRGIYIINYWSGFYGIPLLDESDFLFPEFPLAQELEIAWREPGSRGTEREKVKIGYCENIPDIDIKVHGIDLGKTPSNIFNNSYVPWKYWDSDMNNPTDCGILSLCFNLNVNKFQPSGHLNFSRGREVYLQYNNLQEESVLTYVARAINFLLISDGSCIMRYST